MSIPSTITPTVAAKPPMDYKLIPLVPTSAQTPPCEKLGLALKGQTTNVAFHAHIRSHPSVLLSAGEQRQGGPRWEAVEQLMTFCLIGGAMGSDKLHNALKEYGRQSQQGHQQVVFWHVTTRESPA